MNQALLDDIVNQLSKLDVSDIQHIFYRLLRKKKVDLHSLSKAYVESLENDSDEYRQQILDSTTCLTQYKDRKPTNKEQQLILEYKANEALIKTGIYKDTVYEVSLRVRNIEIKKDHADLHIFKSCKK